MPDDLTLLSSELAKREMARRWYAEYLPYVHGKTWRKTRMSRYLASEMQAFLEEDTGHAYDILVIEAPPQHGKLVRDEELVPTPTGWKKHGELKPGDYVFIQFGHNDEKPKPDRHTDPGSTFDANLRRFVEETRQKGGIPVLFNSVVRRCWYAENLKNDDDEKLRKTVFDGEEKINSDTLIDTHGAYVVAPRCVAQELNVPFVDATKITHDIETSLGIKGSRSLHMWYKPGEVPSIPKGRMDNTHYNVYGARIIAGALADAIGKAVPALGKHVRHYDYVVSAEGRGNFMTLQDAVNAVPAGKKTTILILGGKWNKPTGTQGKKIKYVKYWGAKVK